jgi:hypothetical protein
VSLLVPHHPWAHLWLEQQQAQPMISLQLVWLLSLYRQVGC